MVLKYGTDHFFSSFLRQNSRSQRLDFYVPGWVWRADRIKVNRWNHLNSPPKRGKEGGKEDLSNLSKARRMLPPPVLLQGHLARSPSGSQYLTCLLRNRGRMGSRKGIPPGPPLDTRISSTTVTPADAGAQTRRCSGRGQNQNLALCRAPAERPEFCVESSCIIQQAPAGPKVQVS